MEQKTIPQIEKELTETLERIGARKWTRLGGSWRGNRKAWGPFIAIEFPSGARISQDDVSAIYYIVRQSFGPCWLPVREISRGCGPRRVRVVLKEGKE